MPKKLTPELLQTGNAPLKKMRFGGGFDVHKYLGDLRMLPLQGMLHLAGDGMARQYTELRIDLQVQIHLKDIPDPAHPKVMVGHDPRSGQDMLSKILDDTALRCCIQQIVQTTP